MVTDGERFSLVLRALIGFEKTTIWSVFAVHAAQLESTPTLVVASAGITSFGATTAIFFARSVHINAVLKSKATLVASVAYLSQVAVAAFCELSKITECAVTQPNAFGTRDVQNVSIMVDMVQFLSISCVQAAADESSTVGIEDCDDTYGGHRIEFLQYPTSDAASNRKRVTTMLWPNSFIVGQSETGIASMNPLIITGRCASYVVAATHEQLRSKSPAK